MELVQPDSHSVVVTPASGCDLLPLLASSMGPVCPGDAPTSPSLHTAERQVLQFTPPQANKAQPGHCVEGVLGPHRPPRRWASYQVLLPGAGLGLPGDACTQRVDPGVTRGC